MTLAQLAASLAAVLFLVLAMFQSALALGAPLGAYAWGGAHAGTLPRRLRIGSALTAPLLVVFALMVLARARLIFADFADDTRWALFVVALFLVLNTVGNWRSVSPGERRVMTPLALILTLLVIYVAVKAV